MTVGRGGKAGWRLEGLGGGGRGLVEVGRVGWRWEGLGGAEGGGRAG